MSTRTSPIIPRSTIESIGSSGSGMVPRVARTASSVSIARSPCRPGIAAPDHRDLAPQPRERACHGRCDRRTVPGSAARRQPQRREDRLDGRSPARLEDRHRGGQDAGRDQLRFVGERREDGRRVRAERLERRDQPVPGVASRTARDARTTSRCASRGSAPRAGACRPARRAAPTIRAASASRRTASDVSYR